MQLSRDREARRRNRSQAISPKRQKFILQTTNSTEDHWNRRQKCEEHVGKRTSLAHDQFVPKVTRPNWIRRQLRAALIINLVVHHENSNISSLNLQQICTTKTCGKLIFLSSARFIPGLSCFNSLCWVDLSCVNLQRFHNALLVPIYRDFMMPCLRQFTEILWCPACVNLQRFHGALFASIYRDLMVPCLRQFTEISWWCPVCANLQRFYDALFALIYRDFTVLCLRQFTEISQCHACVNLQRFHDALSVSIYIDFMMGGGGCSRQFTEILRCPACVNLQRFDNALLASIYRDFITSCLCQFTEILCVSLQRFRFENSVQLFYRHFRR